MSSIFPACSLVRCARGHCRISAPRSSRSNRQARMCRALHFHRPTACRAIMRSKMPAKRNVSINLNVPGAYELALKLCDTADIVVENFRAGTLGFFGLDYADPVEAQSAADLRVDHRLRAGWSVAQPDGLRADGAGRSRLYREQRAPLWRGLDGAAHRQPVACRRLCRFAGRDRHPRGAPQPSEQPVRASISTSRWRRPCLRSTNARMSICPTTISARSLRCLAPPIARSSQVRRASISPSRPALSAAGRFRPGCARCAGSDLMDDPRFSSCRGATAEFRRAASDHPVLDADLSGYGDARRPVRRGQDRHGRNPLDQGAHESDWSDYWGAVQLVSDRSGGEYRLPGRPWHFSQGRADPDRRHRLSRASTTGRCSASSVSARRNCRGFPKRACSLRTIVRWSPRSRPSHGSRPGQAA